MHRNLHLLVLLLLGSAGSKDVALYTVLVCSVLERQLAEGSNHVLDVRVLPVAVLAAELVEPGDAVEEVVDDGDDDGDTDGVTPDNADSDDAGASIRGTEKGVVGNWVGWLSSSTGQPTEDTEESGDDIDKENGDNKFP